MAFYEELSRYYDGLFTTSESELAFVNKYLHTSKKVMDIGCGTGNKTELLAGGEIFAFDDSPSMIELATQRHQKSNIHYQVLGMADMASAYAGHQFDAVLCLGNTLVHLPKDAMAGFIGNMHSLLLPEGLCIIQILNYSYILNAKIDTLPLLTSDSASLERRYSIKDNGLGFDTVLTDLHSGKRYENSVTLQALLKGELEQMLLQAGFSDISYYGGYDGSPLQDSSFVLIAVCRRGQ